MQDFKLRDTDSFECNEPVKLYHCMLVAIVKLVCGFWWVGVRGVGEGGEGRGWGLGEGGMHVGGRDGLDFKVSI